MMSESRRLPLDTQEWQYDRQIRQRRLLLYLWSSLPIKLRTSEAVSHKQSRSGRQPWKPARATSVGF